MRILCLVFMFMVGFPIKENQLVIQEKEITVSGNTSFGEFACTYNVSSEMDTLIFKDNLSSDQFTFEISVNEFGCGNFLLNKDFRKTIKAKEYPKAHVRVTNLKRNRLNYSCDLYLEIVGKKIYYKDFNLLNQHDRLKGDLRLSFDDLDLEPPTKFGGLIKVEETLYLTFSLIR